MPFTYVNHWGVTYYLNEAASRSGKPTYSFSKKPGAKLAESLPEGYEVYERPQSGQPFLRKIQKTLMTPDELSLVRALCLEHHRAIQIRVLAEPQAIVVCFAEPPSADLIEGISRFMTITPAKLDNLYSTMSGPLEPAFRFGLVNAQQRTFEPARWYCRGATEGWLPVGQAGPLGPLVRRLAPHLGQDSYFTLE